MYNSRSTNSSPTNRDLDVDGVILDAELLVKYRFIDRAIASLEYALQFFPKNVKLREKLCEICLENNSAEKAAEHLVALSAIHAENGDLERANAMLIQAKSLNPQVSVSAKIEALKKIQSRQSSSSLPIPGRSSNRVLSGDLGSISIFDVIQIIENSRITGILSIDSENVHGKVFFNCGQIADAELDEMRSNKAFRHLIEAETGTFEMERSMDEYPQNINAPNNTNLILDVLREIDEERRDRTI
ncbi:MAG: DUF4388 domain-containing protein [Blastocatellia bacterium]|nr:DUF4388 domain-containing protein [Blastocatellia bacterium]